MAKSLWRWFGAGLLCLSQVAIAAEDLNVLKKKLEERFGDLKVRELKPTAVAGVYEMVFGTRIAYVTADGRYMITGNLVDLESRRNLTTERRTELVKLALETVGDSKMIVFAGKKSSRTVTVFTDVDCPYCAKLHLEVPALTKAGVKVRYLLFPRAGKNSDSYKRTVSVWCAKDRNKAIGIAKAGGTVDAKTCPNPVDDHMALGEDIGVTGTPTLILDDGRIIPGYVPAPELLAMLGLKGGSEAAPAR